MIWIHATAVVGIFIGMMVVWNRWRVWYNQSRRIDRPSFQYDTDPIHTPVTASTQRANGQTSPVLSFPPIIHQTWKTSEIPEHWQASRDAWRQHFPDHCYLLWTDERNLDFMKHHFADQVSLYESWPDPIQRADHIRYCFLYYYGGIYCDLDNYPTRNFEEVFAGTQCEAYVVQQHLQGWTNALMFSKPGAAVWIEVMKEMYQASQSWYAWIPLKHFRVINTTGPMMMSRALRKYQGIVGRLPPSWNPHPIDDRRSSREHEGVIGKLRSGSWHSWDSRMMEHFRIYLPVYLILLACWVSVGAFQSVRWILQQLWRIRTT
jgi:inositol phosphorylceramide mannosyltransferase catalytic subunit